MCVCVLTWSTYQPVCGPAWFTCQCSCVPTCQERGIVSFLRANVIYDVPIFQLGVPIWHTACLIYQLGLPMCQKHANFPIFLLQNAKGNFNTLFLHKNFTLYLISQVIYIYISYVYVLNIKIVLYFISILHVILKKSVWNYFFFIISFLLFSENLKYKKTWFLYVTSNKGFFEFSPAKTTRQNKEYV